MQPIVRRVLPSRPPREAIAAWVLTGPLGHLYAGVADWAVLLVRLVRARGRWEHL